MLVNTPCRVAQMTHSEGERQAPCRETLSILGMRRQAFGAILTSEADLAILNWFGRGTQVA